MCNSNCSSFLLPYKFFCCILYIYIWFRKESVIFFRFVFISFFRKKKCFFSQFLPLRSGHYVTSLWFVIIKTFNILIPCYHTWKNDNKHIHTKAFYWQMQVDAVHFSLFFIIRTKFFSFQNAIECWVEIASKYSVSFLIFFFLRLPKKCFL